MKITHRLGPIVGGLICGYLFFLLTGFIPGVAVFFIPDEWRGPTVAGFARLMGSWMFVFSSAIFARSMKAEVATLATWLAIAYFSLVGALLVYGFYVGVAGSAWFPIAMSICGIAGALLGRLNSIEVENAKRRHDQIITNSGAAPSVSER